MACIKCTKMRQEKSKGSPKRTRGRPLSIKRDKKVPAKHGASHQKETISMHHKGNPSGDGMCRYDFTYLMHLFKNNNQCVIQPNG